jgi:DICT domain-containing protein
MSLRELIAGVEAHEKTLTVFNADEAVLGALRDRFADRNVAVEAGQAADGPRNYAVLHEDDRFVTAVSVESVLADEEEQSVGFADAPYRPILDELDETMFTTFSVPKMVAASREIEDRAWRVGQGALHSGFQTVSTLETQREVYERLGGREGLSVHAYAYPDVAMTPPESFVLHTARTSELAQSWFVAFDGAGVDENCCALVAEEREDGAFYGFWTYDPETVDHVLDYLEETYVAPEPDDGPDTAADV